MLNKLAKLINLTGSVKSVIVVPFVIIITGAVSVTGYFSFKNGQEAINDISKQQ